MASLVGQAAGRPAAALERRARAGSGFVAFVVFGTLGAAVADGLDGSPAPRPRRLARGTHCGLAFAVALACALVESLPTTLDDNLTVPLAGAVVLSPLRPGRSAAASGPIPDSRDASLAGPGGERRDRVRRLAGPLDRRGGRRFRPSSSARSITAGLGLPGAGAHDRVLRDRHRGHQGSATAIKAARGIAQEKGGARGWRHAWANGGVPAFLALLAGYDRGAPARPAGPGLRGRGGHRRRRHLLLRGRARPTAGAPS